VFTHNRYTARQGLPARYKSRITFAPSPIYTFASLSFLLFTNPARLPFASSTQTLDRLRAFRRRRHDSSGHSKKESSPERERGRSSNHWIRTMHKSKDEAKRSRSPSMRGDSSSEVRERTPLGRSEASHSDDARSEEDSEPPSSEPPSSSTKAQDITSSPASDVQEPSMPYFLQLTDLGMPSLSHVPRVYLANVFKILLGSSMS